MDDPNELENLYEAIANGNIPELEWKSPGRVHQEQSVPENDEKPTEPG